MVRKRRTELPGSGESSETRQSIGSSHPAVPTHWLETNPTSQQQRAGAGRGSVPSNPHLPQQAGRGSAGYQGHGGWRPHGVPAPQQPGAPAQGYRVRGGPLPGGAMPPQQQHGVWQVVIRFAARADLHHLEMFLTGRQPDAPQDALQVLDIVLRELPTAR
ncbi:hypothetical protein BHE74_00011281 [Ensete ventricosum]|nr:hypothetical protein BHE74_00011281 [Ensete ventricosum]